MTYEQVPLLHQQNVLLLQSSLGQWRIIAHSSFVQRMKDILPSYMFERLDGN